MAARHSCQCYGDSSSACQTRQQQLLTSYRSSSSKVCESLLGCWLSNLNGSSPDITQLVEVQLVLVQPKLESLYNSNSSGRRRVLQIVPSLNEPIVDDSSDWGLENGQYTDTPKPLAPTPSVSVGMNGGISGDITSSPIAATPVENPGGIPAADPDRQSDDSGVAKPESGQVGSGWEAGSGTSGSNGSSSTGSSSSDGASSDGAVQMTGGNAPSSFWQCAGQAAVKADTTRKWADVDYNSQSLTLNTWIRVIQPTVNRQLKYARPG